MRKFVLLNYKCLLQGFFPYFSPMGWGAGTREKIFFKKFNLQDQKLIQTLKNLGQILPGFYVVEGNSFFSDTFYMQDCELLESYLLPFFISAAFSIVPGI